jgi:hypothetical protein
MSARAVSVTLRAAAIAIAIAGVIDPVATVSRPRPAPLVLINLSQSEPADVLSGLRNLGADVRLRDGSGRLPCAPGERCVIAADGSRDAKLPADLSEPISLVRLPHSGGANIAIESASITTTQHGATSGVATVSLKGQGVEGRRITVRVLDAGAVIGSTAFDWKQDGTQSIEVPWWPLASGARVLRVEARVDGADAIAFDNAVDLPVTVTGGKSAVLVFDTRPSWSSTFVRRALEADPRFVVDHRVRIAPALTAGTAAGRLDPAVLDAAPLVIAGAPDALSEADVELLDHYVRNRGGSLILLPERAPSGPAARLFDGEWREQLLAQPETAGPLRAAELLRPRAIGFGSSAISPVVIATPRGLGRIAVSGAMDAWRHRDEGDAFDRFWTSVAAESAALGEKLRIDLDRTPAEAGSRVPFTIRFRSMTAPDTMEATAVASCDRAQAVRVWPAGPAGVFTGELPVGNVPSCTIEVGVNGFVAHAGIATAQRPMRPVTVVLAKLDRAARASGGVVTDEDNLEPIRDWNRTSPTVNEASPWRPMHSTWWLVPFAACLCGEWWLRRRQGLR